MSRQISMTGFCLQLKVDNPPPPPSPKKLRPLWILAPSDLKIAPRPVFKFQLPPESLGVAFPTDALVIKITLETIIKT